MTQLRPVLLQGSTFRATLAAYWGLPRSLAGLLMPAFWLTKHWLGMPQKLSLARLTSWYSSVPAGAQPSLNS